MSIRVKLTLRLTMDETEENRACLDRFAKEAATKIAENCGCPESPVEVEVVRIEEVG